MVFFKSGRQTVGVYFTLRYDDDDVGRCGRMVGWVEMDEMSSIGTVQKSS